MKTYRNVDITVIERNNKKEINSLELAKILLNTSNETIQEAFVRVCNNDSGRVIRMAKDIHGILYQEYWKMAKTIKGGTY